MGSRDNGERGGKQKEHEMETGAMCGSMGREGTYSKLLF